MTARDNTRNLMAQLGRRDIFLSFDDANTLRRAQITLRRWAEQECGDANEYASWGIERDESTGHPYMCRYANNGKNNRWRIPDREAGALRRVADVCKRNGLHFYHQTDPRGCALYVDRERLPENDYTRGIACA